MTSKLVVNTIEADTGISSVSFASSISMSSTSKFHFSAAGIDIGADTNINRPAAGVLGFNVNGAEKVRIDSSGHMHGVGVVTATHFYGDGSNLTGLPAGTTINSNTNNYLITGTGTANTLQGESTLTYDGNDLTQTTNANGEGIKINGGNNSSSLTFNANRGSQAVLGVVYGRWNSTTVAQMSFVTGDDSSAQTISLGGGILFTGGSGITTSISGNEITFATDGAVVTETSTDTLTNKTISGASNTLSNIGNSSLSNTEAQRAAIAPTAW